MKDMDRIDITGLKIETGIGTYDWEQGILQTVEIDLTLFADMRQAGASDDLADAVDYHIVSQEIEKLLAGRHFQLVEALATNIAETVLKTQPITALIVTVSKPDALTTARSVSVTLERHQDDLT